MTTRSVVLNYLSLTIYWCLNSLPPTITYCDKCLVNWIDKKKDI